MKNKGVIAFGIIIAVVVIAYIITALTKNKGNKTTATDKSKKTTTTTDTARANGQVVNTVATNNGLLNQTIFPLKRGSNHEAVLYLKKALNYIAEKHGYNDIKLITTTDANAFGTVTENALYKLYGQRVVTRDLAKRIATDADMSQFVTYLNYIK